MNTRYCLCGAKTEYIAAKPRFCSSCGAAFDAAFASTPFAPVAQPVHVQPTDAPLVPARSQHPAARSRTERTFQSVRDQCRAPIEASQDNDISDDHGDFDDSPVDRDAAYAEGMAIAAQLDPASFGIGGAPKQTFRFGDLPNLRETATKMSGNDVGATKKRAARGKKAGA